MYSSDNLTPPQAVRLISNWLNKTNYTDVFPNDISLLLSDNRRSRAVTNHGLYGHVPFGKSENGKITYKLEDLFQLCNERIKPICARRLAIKLAIAAHAAGTVGKPYYDGSITAIHAPANDVAPVTDAMLNRLLEDIEAEDPLDRLLAYLDEA